MTTFLPESLQPAAPYVIAALGAALAMVSAASRMRRASVKRKARTVFLILAAPLALFCARLCYCLCSLSWFLQKGVGTFFDVSEGGFMLWGTLGGILLSALIASASAGEKAARMLDCLAAPAALLIVFCRLAEGAMGQGYGWDIESWFTEEGYSLFPLDDPSAFCRFPFGLYDGMYEQWNWSVFLLEAAWALVTLCVLLRARTRRDGSRMLLFLLLYAAMQCVFESLRQDAVLRWGFVRVSQVLSACVVGAVLCGAGLRAPKPRPGKTIVLSWLGLLGALLVILTMEFCVEKKIVALEWLPMDACYFIMALACAAMIFCVLPLWRRADAAK